MVVPTEEQMEQLQKYVDNIKYLEDYHNIEGSNVSEYEKEQLQKYVDNIKYLEENGYYKWDIPPNKFS